jgi:hypothetical protein
MLGAHAEVALPRGQGDFDGAVEPDAESTGPARRRV